MARRVLVVDDVVTDRIVLKVRLAAAQYDVLLAADGASALQMARDEAPDLLLIDYDMPTMTGLELVKRLRADPACAHVPLVMLTPAGDGAAGFAALQAGVDDYVAKPVDGDLLLARVRSLLRGQSSARDVAQMVAAMSGLAEPPATFQTLPRVALVSSVRESAMSWRRALSSYLHAEFKVMGPDECLACDRQYDLYLLGVDPAQDARGLQLLSELRARDVGLHAVVAVVLPQRAKGLAVMALDLGATTVVYDPLDPRELAVRAHYLIGRKTAEDRARRTLEHGLQLALVDPLTGLHNRRYVLPELHRRVRQAAEIGRPLAVMLLDIDVFKEVNDNLGHAVGDSVLAQLAGRLRTAVPTGTLLGRIGGDEFLIAAEVGGAGEAASLAEQIRHAAETPAFLPVGLGHPVPVTVSIGVALSGGQGSAGLDEVLTERADAALRDAKTAGRNRVALQSIAAA